MKKLLAKMMAFLAAIIIFASCSKSSDSPSNQTGGGYPKTNVNVEYRVTKISGAVTRGDVAMMLGTTNTDFQYDQALPYSKKVTYPQINKMDGLYLSFTGSNGGTVQVDILVDGKVVKSGQGTGTGTIYIPISYMFQ